MDLRCLLYKIYYDMHLVFSVSCVFTSLLVTASNGRRSPSSGYPNCSRTSYITPTFSRKLILDSIFQRHSRRRLSHKLDWSELNWTTDLPLQPLCTGHHKTSFLCSSCVLNMIHAEIAQQRLLIRELLPNNRCSYYCLLTGLSLSPGSYSTIF
jgi:hypothetical protein